MRNELSKVYDPKEIEERIYKFWEEGNFFRSEIRQNKEKYTVAMPPPNITGRLHMGHALDNTIQDILVRFKRMKGFETLWIPGTDHAAIATEAKIVEDMKKEGIKKEDIGRDEFVKRALKWKEDYGNIITKQIKKLGASCDWTRQRFTMDKQCSSAVREFFVRMYEKGLIYRGEKIINWCPNCMTTISDAEVNFKEKPGKFWHVKYKISDEENFVVVMTTRPETILGDTALAVHPDDSRYRNLVGKEVLVPLVGRKIPVVADSYVDKDFGTGIVKITPAHDPNDFELGLRHGLSVIKVMDKRAIMNENAMEYEGLSRYEARSEIVKDLEESGSLVRAEEMTHNVGTCYRCSEVIEPYVSVQWFVKMEPLAKPAIEAVKNRKIKFIPERFSKIYYHWMENVKDWCISRQIWWGHRIPAWYCKECGNINVSKEDVCKCEKCQSEDIVRDEDTLDTWFSSALWPFSTLGWPDKTEDFKYYYPTDTLVTGYDIIFFWVARMIFSAEELTNTIPFKNVFIHGLVRDSKGRKMSKSLGNGIDPIEIIEKYGADALRFALVTGNSPGNDMRFSDEKILASRSFVNKIWNAARFIHMNVDDYKIKNVMPQNRRTIENWIISRINRVSKEVSDNLEKFEIGIALQKIYEFIWDEFCDWYIEFSKIRLKQKNEYSSVIRETLVYVLTKLLELLHPFMPYVTEEIWQSFPNDGKSIVFSPYPEYREDLCFESAENEIVEIMNIVRSIRNIRNEMNIKSEKRPKIYVMSEKFINIQEYEDVIKNLTHTSEIFYIDKKNEYENVGNFVSIVTNFSKVFIPMDELIDRKEEISRLENEINNLKLLIEKAENQLKNQEFVKKAPAKVVESVRSNKEMLEKRLKKIELTLESFHKDKKNLNK